MTATSDQKILFIEDFTGGLAVGERWQPVGAGDFVADDGAVTRSAAGIRVAPVAKNSATGEPMFTKDHYGPASHLKWMVSTTEAFSTQDGPLRVSFRVGARCFGTAEHPYGDGVVDAGTDIRLGAATLNVLDFVSGMVFDFWLTSTAIYPWYERLRLPGFPGDYATFGSVSDPIPRAPDAVHELAIIVDVANHTVGWEVDGTVVASVDRIGPPAPGWHLVLDHGGVPEDANLDQVVIGMGLMTLLDAALPPSERGLVYVGTPLVSPTEFQAQGPALFGQGVELSAERIVVERG